MLNILLMSSIAVLSLLLSLSPESDRVIVTIQSFICGMSTTIVFVLVLLKIYMTES